MVRLISTGSPFEKKIGCSRAVVDGEMVYVSGTTGYDYTAMTMPEDVAAQTANALATIGKALEDADSSLKDVVRVRYYLSDVATTMRWSAPWGRCSATSGRRRRCWYAA